MIEHPLGKWTDREASYVEKTVSRKEKDKDTFIRCVPPLKFLWPNIVFFVFVFVFLFFLFFFFNVLVPGQRVYNTNKRNTTLTTIKQLTLQESLYLYEMKFRNHTVNDGDQATSGTSFNRLTTCLKQRNQLLTFSLQNLHITEYTGKSFQVSSTMQRFPCRCSRSHKKYRLAIFLYLCLCKLLLILA